MRAATMSPMISTDHETYVSEPGYYFRKLVLLVLLISAAVLWTAILFKDQTEFPSILSTFFADAIIGMVAGFGTRVVLRSRGLFVQSLTGVLVALYGMCLIGSQTNWVLGIGPIALQPDAADQLRAIRVDGTLPAQIGSLDIDPQAVLDLQQMDWADPLHLLGSLLMTLMALYAWRTYVPAASQSVDLEPLPAPAVYPQPRPAIRTTSGSNGRSRVRPAGGLLARLRPGAGNRFGSRSRNGVGPMVFRDAKSVGESRSRRRRRSRSKANIQFALVEEHRCPYCLDTVSRNDSRGVKECEICHTLHHADCWAITGVCQVPHLNT